MSYNGETQTILQKMLDFLSQEGSLEPGFLRDLEQLVREGKMEDERAVASFLDNMAQETGA